MHVTRLRTCGRWCICLLLLTSRLELDKPASSLYPHNISSILETGIRATSAKIDDLDLHGRLDVRLLAPSENETGWDVFILDYNVSGPIGTVRLIKFYTDLGIVLTICAREVTLGHY